VEYAGEDGCSRDPTKNVDPTEFDDAAGDLPRPKSEALRVIRVANTSLSGIYVERAVASGFGGVNPLRHEKDRIPVKTSAWKMRICTFQAPVSADCSAMQTARQAILVIARPRRAARSRPVPGMRGSNVPVHTSCVPWSTSLIWTVP
jgi:hypothetical protein